MNEHVILTDCDGVILDWEKHFEEWMQNKGYFKIDNFDITAYGLHLHYGVPRPEIQSLVAEFNHSAAIGFVPAFRDAVGQMRRLRSLGYRFNIITSLSTYDYSVKLRRYNLENVLGFNDFELECLEVGADKDEALSKWVGHARYWVEDKLENAIVGHDLGFQTFLMEHDHNKKEHPDGIIRVTNWGSIVNKIIQG